MKQFYVYLITNRSGTLYTGVTNDLLRRVFEHKKKLVPGFTERYRIDKLVYFETTQDPLAAIGREKEIKGWLRKKKVALIESINPRWKDLSEGWYEPAPRIRHSEGRAAPPGPKNLGRSAVSVRDSSLRSE